MFISQNTDFSEYELDELFWFTNKRKGHKNGVNIYIMTMISRKPRQIVNFCVDNSANKESIQRMVDSVPFAKKYYTDGGMSYLDVVFAGKHIRNVNDKKDTHNIESTNADLRHYIAGLARRSRCFFRSKETLEAVLFVFIDAYNKFGEAKQKYHRRVKHTSTAKHLHEYADPPFSVIDFL